MSKLKNIVNLLFPSGETSSDRSELIERGLQALREARDQKRIAMGKAKLVPARLELHLPPGLFDQLLRHLQEIASRQNK